MLAGQTISFDVEVIDVREATEEEIARSRMAKLVFSTQKVIKRCGDKDSDCCN